MNFKKNESATKLRGGYYTKPEIAEFLLDWVMEIQPTRLLEPSCGDGVFFRTLSSSQPMSPSTVLGFEIDPDEAEKARVAGRHLGPSLTVRTGDFLAWAVRTFMSGEQFDAVVGNPPFIRYQYCEPDLQAESEAIFNYFDLRFTRHTNAWVPFVVASVAFLRPSGRLAMVIPAEILHVLHAQSLRNFLARECSRILLLDPEELWFEDVLQGAVLLMAEKKKRPDQQSEGVAIVRTRHDSFLDVPPTAIFDDQAYANGSTIDGKWMRALLTESEREILHRAEDSGLARRFREVAQARVGIVTGANKFFLVPDRVVEQYELGDWAHPMFGRSEHVPGVIYDADQHQRNKSAGLPSNFLWFGDTELKDLPRKAQEYMREGMKQDLHTRYKCRIRDPWYSVPSVYATPVGMLKRCHDFPRMILNRLQAFTTDTAYRIEPHGLPAEDLVFSFVNSLTALSAELEGRHYGGGVLELVPSEIENLLVPQVTATDEDLKELDELVVAGGDASGILRKQDKKVLCRAGMSVEEAETVHEAWLRLRHRRQRKES